MSDKKVRARKFRTDFDMQINVSFSHPEQAAAYWLGDGFKNSMWDFDDINEVAQNIARSFHHTREHWDKDRAKWVKELEGFGLFVPNDDQSKFVATYEDWPSVPEFKDLVVTVGYELELEPDPAFEVTA